MLYESTNVGQVLQSGDRPDYFVFQPPGLTSISVGSQGGYDLTSTMSLAVKGTLLTRGWKLDPVLISINFHPKKMKAHLANWVKRPGEFIDYFISI